MLKILVLHGPNLNMLGTREPEIYGKFTLEQINDRLRNAATKLNCEVETFQSNSEGELIDMIQKMGVAIDGLIVNLGAYTHYSLALRDAISAFAKPTVEVHLSNIYAREPFRHVSVTAPVCRGLITGLGWRGYILALEALVGLLREGEEIS
ncbi:MAG TPA: type II 3-dehydroquinate dehydratase [Ktedonobacteraceae bacterium]|nr:type II 3-dehydroquinate dehydratase [Ktedonobacteraceae bacterium]